MVFLPSIHLAGQLVEESLELDDAADILLRNGEHVVHGTAGVPGELVQVVDEGKKAGNSVRRVFHPDPEILGVDLLVQLIIRN